MQIYKFKQGDDVNHMYLSSDKEIHCGPIILQQIINSSPRVESEHTHHFTVKEDTQI